MYGLFNCVWYSYRILLLNEVQCNFDTNLPHMPHPLLIGCAQRRIACVPQTNATFFT